MDLSDPLSAVISKFQSSYPNFVESEACPESLTSIHKICQTFLNDPSLYNDSRYLWFWVQLITTFKNGYVYEFKKGSVYTVRSADEMIRLMMKIGIGKYLALFYRKAAEYYMSVNK